MNLPTHACKRCGKAVAFGLDENGVSVELDPTPPVYDIVSSERPGGVLVNRNRNAYVSHFATCPQANKHSGGFGGAPLNTRGARTAASASAEAAERQENREVDDAGILRGD